MAHRSERRLAKQRFIPRSQTVINSTFARPQLSLATWTNPLLQPKNDHQQQAWRMPTHDISHRLAGNFQIVDLDHHPSRRLKHNSENPLIQNDETVSRHHTTLTQGGIRSREPSVSNVLPRIVNSSVQTPQSNQTLTKPDPLSDRIESSNPLETALIERLACEITMSYASIVSVETFTREEIIVMQRSSTGDTSLVYRGYLSRGGNQTFSFKSQRRPTSSLSLAFYVEGSLDNVTNECCEFNCVQKESNVNDQKQFLFIDIQKAYPCEKCRQVYANNLFMNGNKNTLLVRKRKKPSHNPDQSHIDLKPSSAVIDSHIDKKESIAKQHPHKSSKDEKPKVTQEQHVFSTGADAILLESDKPVESSTTQLIPLHTTETSVAPTEQKSDEDTQETKDSETTAGSADAIDIRKFLHMLMTQRQTSKMKRHVQSVENFCYIIEKNISISNDEQKTLRGLINLGFPFDDINSKECIEFLKKILNEKIILILSKASTTNLSQPIANESLLSAIYVIDPSETTLFDSKFYRGSFPDITSFCQRLKDDLQSMTDDLTYICSMSGDHTGMNTLTYVQALKDILLQMDEKRDLKKEMIDFCREEYAENPIQLKFIDEFSKYFQPKDAIQWFLRRETFVHKMITRAFRVLDPDILFKLRYFIQQLHEQLKSHSDTSTLTVYRTLRIRKDLFEKMKKNQGGLLSFNEFLFADKSQSTIEPSPINTASKLVHFRMVLGGDVGVVGRCEVTSQPHEVLLTIGTVFRIDKLEQIDEETFTVELTANADIRKVGDLLTHDLRDAVHASLPLVSMLKLMKQREFSNYIEYFCSMLMDDPQTVDDSTANLTLGGALHFLGSYYYEKKQYDQALTHLQNSLKVYLRVLPSDDIKLTPTYNNIGSIFHKQGLNEQALEYHLKAYEIQKNSKEPDLDSVAAYVGNTASVLLKLGKHEQAIHYLEIDLRIKQKVHPNNDHPDVAIKHHNLAGAQYRLQQYSKALENYEKCLDIELKCHSKENPTVAVTYYNMATALEELGRLQEAQKAVQTAIERLLLTKQEDDEQVQMQKRYLQRLERKLWMKDLFTAT